MKKGLRQVRPAKVRPAKGKQRRPYEKGIATLFLNCRFQRFILKQRRPYEKGIATASPARCAQSK